MVESRRTEVSEGLYGRLLQRLALALDEADSVSRKPAGSAHEHELELSGLSPAELQLVRAYLDQDLSWLQGWHAAAQELALLERQSVTVAKPGRNSVKPLSKTSRLNPLLKRRQQLCCALCGTAADWLHGQGVQACGSCGSQLFRAGSQLL